jgi:hypothetical protein
MTFRPITQNKNTYYIESLWNFADVLEDLLVGEISRKNVVAVREAVEHFIYIGVRDWLAGLVGQQVLFRDIGNIRTVIIFCEQVIKRLIFLWANLFRNRQPPFLVIIKLRVDVENSSTKRIDTVTNKFTNAVSGSAD